MSITVTGVVQSVQTKQFSGQMGVLNGHTISITTDAGQSLFLNKNTKPTTAFQLAAGTKIKATYDAVSGVSKTGQPYTINKIVGKDAQGLPGLIILQGDNSPQQVASPTIEAQLPSKPATAKKEYDSNGARNGMIAGKAVELAIARKALTLEGLKKAADDVKSLTLHVENPEVAKAELPSASFGLPPSDFLPPEDSPFDLN